MKSNDVPSSRKGSFHGEARGEIYIYFSFREIHIPGKGKIVSSLKFLLSRLLSRLFPCRSIIRGNGQ